MDIDIEALDQKSLPIATPSSDKKSVREEFKAYEFTKARTPVLDLLFSALKTIPPSSTEDLHKTYFPTSNNLHCQIWRSWITKSQWGKKKPASSDYIFHYSFNINLAKMAPSANFVRYFLDLNQVGKHD